MSDEKFLRLSDRGRQGHYSSILSLTFNISKVSQFHFIMIMLDFFMYIFFLFLFFARPVVADNYLSHLRIQW